MHGTYHRGNNWVECYPVLNLTLTDPGAPTLLWCASHVAPTDNVAAMMPDDNTRGDTGAPRGATRRVTRGVTRDATLPLRSVP